MAYHLSPPPAGGSRSDRNPNTTLIFAFGMLAHDAVQKIPTHPEGPLVLAGLGLP